MKKEIFLAVIAISIFCCAAFAQTGYYSSYSDFENNRMTVMDDYKSYIGSSGSITIIFLKGEEKVKVKCEEIWGFKYKDNLFRIDAKGQPAYVKYNGKIVHYGNGMGHLKMLKNNTTSTELQYGFFAYLSENLKSEMFPINGNKTLAKFKAANPKYADLADCIGKNFTDGYYAVNIPSWVSGCVADMANSE